MKKIIYLILLCSLLYGESEIKEYKYFKIEVIVKKCIMNFYGINYKGEKELIETYDVATPKKTEVYPKEQGRISKVDLNPWWYPTKRTKEEFKKKKGIILPDAVKPGNKLNYMGSFKIYLSMCTKEKGCVYRIHGNLDEDSIGKRSSGGCIRMHNDEGKEFAKEIVVYIEYTVI